MKPVVFSFLVLVFFLTGPAFAQSDGEAVYKKACATCHDSGVAGAPKLGDKGAWEPRLAEGMNDLYESAINGKGAMPAKGGHKNLTNDQVKAAVNYLTDASK